MVLHSVILPDLCNAVLLPAVSTPSSKVTQITDDLMPKGVALCDYNDREISFKVIHSW